MKKPTYVFLLLITIPLLGYTLYYSSTQQPSIQEPLLSVTATTTEELASATTTEINTKKLLTTRTGKTITIEESNPVSASLSSITITPNGFSTNTPLIVETNKLTDSFLVDINKDSFDELILVTQSQGSGSYGEALMYTTINDTGLTPIPIPKVGENDTKKGGLFEGYMGHDTFTVATDTLIREFPTYTATDTNSNPTGKPAKLFYSLTMSSGTTVVTFSKEAPVYSPASTSQLIATTTPLSKTSWVWISSTMEGATVETPKDIPFTLSFDTIKTLQAVSDCNTITGTYLVTANDVLLSNLVSTKKTCERTSDEVYLELLTKIRTYTLEGTTLTFGLSNKGSLVFTKKK
jgi:heat shock protein HslJ